MTILKTAAALAILLPVLIGAAAAAASSQGKSSACERAFSNSGPSGASREYRPPSRLQAAPIPCWLKPDQAKCRDKMRAAKPARRE